MTETPWPQWTVRDRLRVIRGVRGLIAEHGVALAGTIARETTETLVAEVLPLAEACRFLEREAEALLAPRQLRRGRPVWLAGVTLEVRREPLGRVLIIGPANYPLLLPGVHTLQALAAGNTVLLKPGVAGSAPVRFFADLLKRSGLPAGALSVLSEDPEDAQRAIEAGVDKVILTGSNATGKAVLASLAESVTPSVMELSGCDSVFILEDADLDLAAKALHFGCSFNGGNTCIAPKKVYVAAKRAVELKARIAALRIPVTAVASINEAVGLSAECGYGLGASIFGSGEAALELARRIRAGVVVVNDMIVPTADPRLPFGGRGKSGFGVTRGAEGLLELTAIKAITVRRGRWHPHFEAPHPADSVLFEGALQALHARSWRRRFEGVVQLSRAALARRKAA